MAENYEEYLQRGIEAARAGQKNVARTMLAEALRLRPQSQTAWLWMSGVVNTPEERIQCLQQVLKINPQNEHALKGLRALGVEPQAPPPTPATPEPAPPSPPQAPTDASPVPWPAPEAIEQAKRQASRLLQELNTAIEPPPVPYVRDDSRAAPVELPRISAPRPRIQINPLWIAGGIGAILLVLSIALIATVIGNIRERRSIANATPAPTVIPATETATPAPTITPLPTRTPLPEYLTLTVEPTLTAGPAPRGNLDFRPTETPAYAATPHLASVLSQANAAFYSGDYERALELVRSAREEGQNPIDTYYIEGVSLLRLGEINAAGDAIQAGLALDDTFAPLYLAEGDLLLEQGSPQQAIAAYQRARDLDPNYLEPYLALAGVYIDRGELDNARAEIALVRTLNRYNYDVRLLSTEADIALRTGDIDRALALRRLTYTIDPVSEAVNVGLARVRLEAGHYETAIVDLEDYLRDVFPSSAEAWALLGQAYVGAGRTEDARTAFQRARQLSDGVVEATVGLGQLRLSEGDYTAALENFTAALDVDPENLTALEGRARAAAELGQWATVAEDIEALFEQSTGSTPLEAATAEGDTPPPNLDLLVLYAQALEATAQNEDALTLVEALLLTPISEAQGAALGEVTARLLALDGEYLAALDVIDTVLAVEPTGERHYLRGLLLEDLNRAEDAIEEYEWVLFWDGVYGFEFAEDAAERLEALLEERDALEEEPDTP